MVKPVADPQHNEVTTDSKGVVTVVMHGPQTGETVRELNAASARQVAALRAQGKRVLVIADIRALHASDSTSEARVESRKSLTASSYDACAVIGNNALMTVVMYMMRATKVGKKVRFFSNERAAREWLEEKRHPKDRRTMVSLVSGVAITLIGVAALLGWYSGSQYLTRWIPGLRPMNPMAAIGLLAIGFGFCSYWFGNLRLLKAAGIFGVLLGVAALLPLGIDDLIFNGRLAVAGAHTDLADSAAFCFIAMGLTPFTVGTKKLLVRLLQYVLAITIIGLSMFNIFGQLYAHQFIYSLTPNFVMAFNLAVAFFVAGATLVLLVLYKQVGNVLTDVTRIGWLIMAVLLFVQVITYASWSQVVSRNKATAAQAFAARAEDLDIALNQRFEAYTNALYGFKGLFLASDYVDQGEFQSYYNSLNLAKNYPGLRALSFITKVDTNDIPAFVAKHRTDTSLYPGGNPKLTVTNQTTQPVHYLATYNANATAQSATASDLSANPSRLIAFQKADTSNSPVSSGTVEFAASNGVPAQKGFFITIPVPSKVSGNANVGFVNAVFNYTDFFSKVFPEKLLDNVDVQVTESMDGSILYSSRKGGPAKNMAYSRLNHIPIADRGWNINVAAPMAFGVSKSQEALPSGTLIGGQIFSLLLIFIFVVQARARRQGFDLADSLTEDLQHERNTAVANDQKSLAILSSIGDAVFAIDMQKRITIFNPSVQRISGYTEAEALGQPYQDILHFEYEKNGKINDRFVREALSGRFSSMANHTVLVRKDGKRVQVADSAAPVRDAGQKIIGAIVVFRDVSKDYELDKAKTEFVSLASHQLRTPLSAINWFGEMLLNGDAGKLSKLQHEYITEIFQGNQRMVELVNSLLDVSRLEVGKLTDQPAPTDVGNLVDDLQKELQQQIVTKQLKFTKNVHKLAPVIADPKQLRMIVQNLMSNAVKYTPAEGSVTVDLRPATAQDIEQAKLKTGGPYWYFRVKDSGYGIPKEQQSKIFHKLFRADNVRALDVEGTGLGLYIVKEVVEKLGGRVWFESEEGSGTTFYVVAPISKK
ncbi:MAG TPA: ATP-binding protein [Bacillota bacterium]|nr:ATP-binding protein [Bacillota bacterium]